MCYIDSKKNIDFNLLFSSIIQSIAVDSIKAGVNAAVSKNISGGQWREIQTAKVPMKDFITKSNSTYISAIKEKGAYFVSAYIYVDSFSATLKIDKTNSLGISLKTDSSLTTKLVIGGNINFKKIKDDSIQISCTSPIIPLVKLSKFD